MNQRLVSAACLLSLVMASAGPANAALPEEAYQSFPYSGLILTDTQVPFDGAVSVAVQIYAVQAGSEALIYEETHPEVLVQAGYFSLVLGAGESGVSTPLVELLEPDVVHEVALSIDGAPLGERGILGAVPFAASAARVPATGVLYGGPYGLLPAEAVTPMVETFEAWYQPGELVPTPDGWACEHTATIPNVGQALSLGSEGFHGQDLFVANVGTGTVDVLPGLAIDFSTVPGSPGSLSTNEDLVQVRHAYTACTYAGWSPSCAWTVDSPTSSLPVRVQSVCVPLPV